MAAARWGVGLGAFLLVTVPGDGRDSGDEASREKAAKVLQGVNLAARAPYSAAREYLVARNGPVVLWNGDEIVLRYGSVREARQVMPAVYHDLKTVGHVVLGLDALLSPHGDGKLDDRRVFEVKSHRALISRIKIAIRHRGLSSQQVERQQKILQAVEDYLDGVLREEKAEVKQLHTVLRSLLSPLDENNKEAARAQIDSMHARMTEIKARLSAADWGRLTAIVLGTQQPRKDNVAVQYFARLFGVPGEGRRIVYAEGIFDEAKALQLLGTKLIDRHVGIDLFDDPERMNRDLLGDVGKAYLDELFKKK
ncbi:MAG: hypothetical protein U0797_14795 [Gemmataceae bacterium]